MHSTLGLQTLGTTSWETGWPARGDLPVCPVLSQVVDEEISCWHFKMAISDVWVPCCLPSLCSTAHAAQGGRYGVQPPALVSG